MRDNQVKDQNLFVEHVVKSPTYEMVLVQNVGNQSQQGNGGGFNAKTHTGDMT